MQSDPNRMLEFLHDGVMLYQHVDDRVYVDFVRDCGEGGLRKLSEILKDQCDVEDEAIARYGVSLVVRSRLPGRVRVILDVLRLPFRHRWVRDEVLESVFNEITGDDEFLRDEEFVSEARRVVAGPAWVEEQIAAFLENAAKMRGAFPA